MPRGVSCPALVVDLSIFWCCGELLSPSCSDRFMGGRRHALTTSAGEGAAPQSELSTTGFSDAPPTMKSEPSTIAVECWQRGGSGVPVVGSGCQARASASKAHRSARTLLSRSQPPCTKMTESSKVAAECR